MNNFFNNFFPISPELAFFSTFYFLFPFPIIFLFFNNSLKLCLSNIKSNGKVKETAIFWHRCQPNRPLVQARVLRKTTPSKGHLNSNPKGKFDRLQSFFSCKRLLVRYPRCGANLCHSRELFHDCRGPPLSRHWSWVWRKDSSLIYWITDGINRKK